MISREELYKLVWAQPMTKVAKNLEISDSYLARVCTALNVPRPGVGHWAKLAVGKAPPVIALPEARPGDQLYWIPGEALPPVLKPHIPIKQETTGTKTKMKIPKDRIHGLIREGREHFNNSRPTDEGAYLKPYKKLLLDVTASKACLDKALEFTNEFFNALESAGHRVMLAPNNAPLWRTAIEEREEPGKPRDYYSSSLWSPYRPTVVYVGNIAIGLAVVEMSENVLLRYVDNKYIRETDYVPPPPTRRNIPFSFTTTREIPSGRLRLIAYSPNSRVNWAMTWQETRKVPLQSSLKSIVKSIEASVAELVERTAEAERQAEIEHKKRLADIEEHQRAADRRRIEQSVQESKEHLANVIKQWSNVMSIEQFLAGVEKSATRLSEDERGPVLERLHLARSFLGTQDPLEFFLSWKSPTERYRPKYDCDIDVNRPPGA